MDLKQAVKQIEGDPGLSGRFKADPMAVLTELGVDTTNCKIVDPGASEDEITELSDQELASVAGGTSIEACVYVGVSEEVWTPWSSDDDKGGKSTKGTSGRDR